MRSWMMVTVIGVGALCLAAVSRGDDEERVTLDQVPATVKAAILKAAAGAEIREIERETEDGKTVYEAEFVLGGKEIEVKIAADGSVLSREAEDDDDGDDEDEEETIAVDKIPGPARKALQRLAGDAKIVKAGREKEDGVLIYEAEWAVNGAAHEAAVTADGALIETEEVISAEKAPAAVQAAIAKHFGTAKVVVEKKMIVVYEVEAKVGGKEKELLIFPTGRLHDEHGDHDDDDDDDDSHEHGDHENEHEGHDHD